jgi:replicative DNA helicase
MKPYEGPDQVIDSATIAARLDKEDTEEKMLSGLRGVDDVLRGFRPRQLVVISAPTKSGKTAFCMQLSKEMQEMNPLWFSYEETVEELCRRFIESGQDVPKFYSPSELRGNTSQWIELKIIEAIAKYNTRIVFIDHLHYIVQKNDNMATEIGFLVRELKTIARRWNVVIVLAAHIKKTDMERQPSLDDLKDSSSIAQVADTVIFLWREAKRNDRQQVIITNNVNLSIQANRRFGKTANIPLVFNNGVFAERQWDVDDEFNSL